MSVISHDETSTEPTRLLSGAILQLTSTRKQDFDMAKWDLVRHYAAFLQTDPQRALNALARLVLLQYSLGTIVEVTICGRALRVVADDSSNWDVPSRGRRARCAQPSQRA